ncbi:hypothetical protein DFH06DRAFT_1326451 [Mycena polygramma]|nr:hypothetical protein DFH06DRAFT_1326451 [Mycena polygramma]
MSLTLGGTPSVTIHNGTFHSIAGNMNIVSGDNGLDILYRRVLEDAMHNSAERPPDPACHPGTRESVLHTLRAWSRDDTRLDDRNPETRWPISRGLSVVDHLATRRQACSPGAHLLWLHGSAGMGKSAIAQTFAAECQEDGILGASFFFRRGDPGRGNWKGLFPTLAYQLAASYPEFGNALRQAVERGQAMRHQFQKLIVAPFEQTPPLSAPLIIVIDGLDECADHDVQTILLKLVIEGLRTGAFPVRVLLASRPEAHLREVFEEPANFDVCRHLELDADTSAYDDIRRYLWAEFSRIHACYTSRGIPLENGWPAEDAINHLVYKSSGTFIYVTTVVRYIDDEYSHPTERLNSVLALDPHSTAPLDTLYSQVLSNVPNRSIVRRVLHAVLRPSCGDPEIIDAALNLGAGSSRLALRGLHAIVSVPPVRALGCEDCTEEVELLHASLGDFLRDPMCSLDFFVDTLELNCALVRTMIEFLSSSPTNQYLFDATAVHLLVWICGKQLGELLPTDDLLPILRDVDFQHVAHTWPFVHPGEVVDWLKKFYPLQSDLIQIWEDLKFVSELDQHQDQQHDLYAEVDNSVCSIRDKHYAQLLAENPQVLSVLHVVSVCPTSELYPWSRALHILHLKWNVLRPLSALRTRPHQDKKLSECLIAFIRDPRRAGNLYADLQAIYKFATLHGISRIRQIFTNHEVQIRYQLYNLLELHWQWVHILLLCPPSDRVLHELEDLDLTQSCAHLQINKDVHRHFHCDVLRHNKKIVDWLWASVSFPATPGNPILGTSAGYGGGLPAIPRE